MCVLKKALVDLASASTLMLSVEEADEEAAEEEDELKLCRVRRAGVAGGAVGDVLELLGRYRASRSYGVGGFTR